MHDELPRSELQGLHPVASDGLAPIRWVRSVNRACTAWLLERGLLDEMLEELMLLRHAANQGEPDPEDMASVKDAAPDGKGPSRGAIEGAAEAGANSRKAQRLERSDRPAAGCPEGGDGNRQQIAPDRA